MQAGSQAYIHKYTHTYRQAYKVANKHNAHIYIVAGQSIIREPVIHWGGTHIHPCIHTYTKNRGRHKCRHTYTTTYMHAGHQG